ncbi:MAG TPA: Crp/Fnr family transcriptional regulator [Falsiroseomonas sp.]|jgi:CRP-like cAMP-binding protein|nr:Crp/Fnr family transcriptional regulator [Falsiroseomonas sp.]
MDASFLDTLPGGHERRLTRGETLFRARDPALGLAVVRSGMMELRRLSPEGRLSVLHRAGPGDTFAEASLFEPRHHCDAVAAAPSLITIHPAATLRRAAAEDAALGWRIAAHLAARLVAARARAERLALPHAADRLLDALHALPAEAGGLRRTGRSWKALAAELGLTHEATYRALARLERAGLLRREGPGTVRLAAASGAA